MSRPLVSVTPATARSHLSVEYISTDSPQDLLAPDDTLAVFGFGDAAPQRLDDPRYLHIPLQPHAGSAHYEVWRTDAPVTRGRDGEIAWAGNGQLAFGVIEVEEGADGIAAAAAHAYAKLVAFVRAWGFRRGNAARRNRDRPLR
jgi:chorismate lyase/3-hydroxybenzoate synthase